MGDHQQLTHTIPFSVQANSRAACHPLPAMACYPLAQNFMRPSTPFGPTCPRAANQTALQDNMPLPPAPAMPVNPLMTFVCHPQQQFIFGYPNPSETALAALQVAHPHVQLQHQHPPQLGYQVDPQTYSTMPVDAPRRPVASGTKPPEREKKILTIQHPQTHQLVDLAALSKEPSNEAPPVAPVAPEESPPVRNAGDRVIGRHPPASKSLIPLEELQDKIENIEPVIKEEPIQESADKDEVEDEPQDQSDAEPLVPDSGTDLTESKVARLLGETTDVESSAVSDVEEDEVGRKMYSREFLLKCRDSPITRCPPEDFQLIPLPSRLHKSGRGMGRPHQRVIRLNTTIVVKRVEGAFVPSRLKTKDEAGSERKKLSTDLNVILNRLSGANMQETESDIRKLNFSSPDDLQLLAKLIFQKAIYQSKYSKAFASLCKQLKGFSVPGSENLEGLVIQQSQELFNTPLDTLIAELNTIIDSKIESAKDESVKKILREDRDTNILKKTEAYYGNITFLAELYLCRLFSHKSMIQCLRKLKESAAPESLTSLITLLQTCGPELEQQSKSQLDECFAKLNSCAKSDKVPAHQQYKIQELCELRARGWKKDPQHVTPGVTEAPPRRPTDEKTRWPHLQPNIEASKYSGIQQITPLERKPAQSINPLMPSSLAVTRQSHDLRKLGPDYANWSQGSGQQLKAPADDGSHQGGKGLLAGAANRSREASPRVHGIQNAWVTRQLANAKPREDYSVVLERNRGHARKLVDILRGGEEDAESVVRDLKNMDRHAVLHALFELSMDKDEKLRDAIGKFLLNLIQSSVPPSDLQSGCKMFFEKCDEDFLEDYPKGWEYIAQILQHLIQTDGVHFKTLLTILKHLQSEGRGAIVLAHCLRLSAKRLGEDVVAEKWRSEKLDWESWGVSGDVSSFVEKYMVPFTVPPNFCDQLKQLSELSQKPATSMDEITSFFKQFSQVPPNFVRSCVQTMIRDTTGLPRSSIDHWVLGLGILVDHKPNREAEVVQALSESSQSSVDRWRKSLLDKKVISSEALRTSNDSITRTLLRDS